MAPTNTEHSRKVKKKRTSTGQTKTFKVIKPKRSKRVKRSSKIRMMNWIKKLNIKYGFESSANMASIQTTTKKAVNLIDLPAEVRHLIFSAVLRGCHKDCISHDITKPTSGEMYISLCCMPAIKAAILGVAFASKAFLADLDHFVSDLHLYCTLAEYRKDRLSTVPHVLREKVGERPSMLLSLIFVTTSQAKILLVTRPHHSDSLERYNEINITTRRLEK